MLVPLGYKVCIWHIKFINMYQLQGLFFFFPLVEPIKEGQYLLNFAIVPENYYVN